MFTSKRFKNDSNFSAGTTTLIAAGTKLTGDISFSGNLEIEGEDEWEFEIVEDDDWEKNY